MNGDVSLKICGTTNLRDAEASVEIGADMLGFIFFDRSPRYLAWERFLKMKGDLPQVPRVAVTVKPDLDHLKLWKDAGFDFAQIHFDQEGFDKSALEAYVSVFGKKGLWLAPKRKPGEAFDASLLDYADSIFWDAYKKDAYGGTGHLSDWEGYRLNRELHPDHRWILAGGLGPRNLKAAVEETGSSFVDMVSSVESSPGLKDLDKLKAVRDSLLSVTS